MSKPKPRIAGNLASVLAPANSRDRKRKRPDPVPATQPFVGDGQTEEEETGLIQELLVEALDRLETQATTIQREITTVRRLLALREARAGK